MPTAGQFARVTQVPDAILPTRQTQGAAGYDVTPYLTEPISIAPGSVTLLRTGIKVYLRPGWVLMLVVRSSVGTRRHLAIPHSLGIIDSDYVDNPDNEGEIFLPLWNFGTAPQIIAPGTRLAQGLFVPYGITTDDDVRVRRHGGFGSTGS